MFYAASEQPVLLCMLQCSSLNIFKTLGQNIEILLPQRSSTKVEKAVGKQRYNGGKQGDHVASETLGDIGNGEASPWSSYAKYSVELLRVGWSRSSAHELGNNSGATAETCSGGVCECTTDWTKTLA